MAGTAMASVSGVQVVPPFVVRQMPPPSAPTYTVLASVGCGAMAVTRP